MLAQSIARLVRSCRARTLQQKRGQPSMWQPATLSPASLNTSTTTLVITLGLPPRLAGKPHAPCLLMQSVAYDRPRPKWTKASELVVASWGDHRGRLANCLRHAALADLALVCARLVPALRHLLAAVAPEPPRPDQAAAHR